MGSCPCSYMLLQNIKKWQLECSRFAACGNTNRTFKWFSEGAGGKTGGWWGGSIVWSCVKPVHSKCLLCTKRFSNLIASVSMCFSTADMLQCTPERCDSVFVCLVVQCVTNQTYRYSKTKIRLVEFYSFKIKYTKLVCTWIHGFEDSIMHPKIWRNFN